MTNTTYDLLWKPPQTKKTLNLGQLTQMCVGGVGWSQTFINQCFYGIFAPFFGEISGKFSVNVPNLIKSGGGFTSLGQLSLIYRVFFCFFWGGDFLMDHVATSKTNFK